GVRAEPKIVTALYTSESVSNPSTNSPMMRSTRQESVFVNARRSRVAGVRRRSSSVTACRCEPLESCDMVVLHVVEEGGKPDMAGSRVRDDPRRREVAHPFGRILRGEHHDRRAVLCPGGH